MKFAIPPHTIIRPLLSTRNKKAIDTWLRGRISKGTIIAFRVARLTTLSCTQARAPLDLLSQDSSHDQRQIATYYSWEATVLCRKLLRMSDCSDTIQEGLNRCARILIKSLSFG